METGRRSGRRDIVHLDMDAFYASVEALDNPALRGKPVIVGGDERRGVVCAASYEARTFGVRSAQPVAAARRLCPQGVFLPVRMARYKEVSEVVFGIYRRFTPLVEQLSIDEAFLDVTGSTRLFGIPERIARNVKAAVREETGLTVSAGVGPSKLVAKIASDLGKPDGLVVVPHGGEREFLAPLPAERLWGVGQVTRDALRRMGVRTIGDLSRVSAELLRRKFGVHGVSLHMLARGIDNREVEPEGEARSIGHEDTYLEDIRDVERLRRELLDLSERVSARLRRHGVRGRTVTLKVKYHDFILVTRSETLPWATDDGRRIYGTALLLLERTEAGLRPVRLLGIAMSSLEGNGEKPSVEAEQLSLFRRPAGGGRAGDGPRGVDPAKRDRLNRAVDAIRTKFGERGIVPGTLLEEE